MVHRNSVAGTFVGVWLSSLTIASLAAQGDDSVVAFKASADAFLLHHASDIQEALAYLGSPISPEDHEVIGRLRQQMDSTAAPVASRLQRTLDGYCIAVVEIDAEERVSVTTQSPVQKLQQQGWTNYLVKVVNRAGYTGRLKVASPNARPLFIETRGQSRMKREEMFTSAQLQQRYLALELYRNAPLCPSLSGNRVEYAILQIFSKRSGRLRAEIDFYLGDYYKDLRIIESSSLRPPGAIDKSEGLKAEYFSGTMTPSGTPTLTRIDKEINFDWSGHHALSDVVDRQKFSARWTGHLVARETGPHRLGIRSNDGSRLYLDGRLLVSNWASQGTTLRSVEVELTQGEPRELKVEYFQAGGSADLRLEWDDGRLNPTRVTQEFDATPAVPVVLHIRDEEGLPSMASLTFTDQIGRYEQIAREENAPYGQFLNHGLSDYDRRAQREYEYYPADLKGIYPLPSKRLALVDKYPDQYFHAQVYRQDGEEVLLPPGAFRVTYTRGPEYLAQTRTIVVPERSRRVDVIFNLKRWICLRQFGYYSSDSHIHASGCCYYTNPEEGLRPEHVWRFQLGEDLNVANVLNWVGNWYHQKAYFTGREYPHSDHHHLMRYNVEVSGFPSSHAGHVVLLGLKEDDYPGTSVIEEWPTWNLPILKWAKSQNAITGYAHSGWGLMPMDGNWELPNYAMPMMNDIGANEYIVTVTEGVVDFYSVGDTPVTWELNMWYHSLNCGFRPTLSGETDFPCIYDERVGEARSYVKLEGDLDYDRYLDAIREGRGYVSDGRTHLIDFSVNNLSLGSSENVLELAEPQTVKVTVRAAALLPATPSEVGKSIAASGLDHQPYWHIERARIAATRDILVELVINGVAVDSKRITADGHWNDLEFEHEIMESSWLALRVFPSAHTNPLFAIVGGAPIRNRRSAQWCRRAVDQCWEMKESKISSQERDDAIEAYDRARFVYDELIDQARATHE